jgi:hypothetical protein
MPNALTDLIEQVTDETSFLRFLTALRQSCESGHGKYCRRGDQDCVANDHWETESTQDFLRSVEDWATRGDFAEGVHHGEPMLRRVATMLYVGRYYRSEDRPR